MTIKVGGTRRRTTTIAKELNPVWDETFELWVSLCLSMSYFLYQSMIDVP